MRVGRNRSDTRTLLFIATVGSSGLFYACGDAGESSESSNTAEHTPTEATVVLAQYEGGFDGKDFWFRPMDATAEGTGENSGVGETKQALETDLPNAWYPASGAASITNRILIEQVERRTETNWNTAACGPTPVKGACARLRVVNKYPNQDLFRSYFYLTSMTMNAGVQAWIPAPASDTQTSTPDVGVLGATPASGSGGAPGLWRYGLLEHSAQEPRSPERWVAFVGSGKDSTGFWQFRFIAQIRGTLVTPVLRGSLSDGTRDKAPFYSTNGTAAAGMATGSSIQVTPSGKYVVFASTARLNSTAPASGTKVYRYDTTSGATVIVSASNNSTSVPNGCTSVNPSISDDGNLVTFSSIGCNLGYGTTTKQIYLRNISASTTKLVTHAPAQPTTFANAESQTPRIAGGGGYITFVSRAGNIFPSRPSPRTTFDVYRYDVAADASNSSTAIARANIDSKGKTDNWPDADQLRPDISSNGSLVVFDTAATQLVQSDSQSNSDVFLYDFGGAGISAMSVSSKGQIQHTSQCNEASISSDGTTVAFICATASNENYVTTPTTTAGRSHVYWRTVASEASIKMVDTTPTGTEAGASVGPIPPALNSNGDLIIYAGNASGLLRTSACNTPTGTCLAVPGTVWSPFVRDMASPDPEVQRSFLVSQIRTQSATGTLPFAPALGGLATASNGRVLNIFGARNGAAAAYLINGGTSTDWAQDPSTGGPQVYLSPVSDALHQ